GIEWMEGHGADLVSSSLGYNIFDDGSGYLWSRGDFNGRTSVTARAALRAARLGVVVCDAMGNERNGDGNMGTMLTPADADSIISVGAVTFSKKLASFSSTGPTNDGRTKPDIVAPGVSVFCAIVPNTYGNQQGTSLATPLAAGSAALLLSVRPELSPVQVRDAMRATAEAITDSARFPLSPNNFTGWGLVNAFEAALSFGPVFSNVPRITAGDSGTAVFTAIASRYGIRADGVVLHFLAGGNGGYSAVSMSFDSAMFYPTSGRYRAAIPRQPYGTLVQFYIDASDSGGHSYRSPAASTGTVWHLRYGETGGGRNPSIPGAFALAQNYPNPFNNETVIEYDLPADEFVDIRVFDLTGREVAALVHGSRKAGYGHSVGFDAGGLASGVYFYRMSTPAFTATKKMMVLR
ncbi:MAG: T9SS type A sorting domain-containing protein, partial [Ignavibacteria bacterium]